MSLGQVFLRAHAWFLGQHNFLNFCIGNLHIEFVGFLLVGLFVSVVDLGPELAHINVGRPVQPRDVSKFDWAEVVMG